MLQAIADLERVEASAVLAQAARLVLGSSDRDRYGSAAPTGSELADRVVAELRTRVDSGTQTEDQIFRRITEALSREMSEHVLAGANLDEVKARVGQRGTLPTRQYEIIFSEKFRQQIPLLSIKPTYVSNAIRSAAATQHLSPKYVPSGLSVSLVLQTPRVNGPPYTLLIKCNRIGAQMHVEDAFYLFHDTFDLSTDNTPLEALRQFLNRFGVPIEIVGTGLVGNPLENVVTTFADDGRLRMQNLNGQGGIVLQGTPHDQFESILSYSFDQVTYSAYLCQHGKPSKTVGGITTITSGIGHR